MQLYISTAKFEKTFSNFTIQIGNVNLPYKIAKKVFQV